MAKKVKPEVGTNAATMIELALKAGGLEDKDRVLLTELLDIATPAACMVAGDRSFEDHRPLGRQLDDFRGLLKKHDSDMPNADVIWLRLVDYVQRDRIACHDCLNNGCKKRDEKFPFEDVLRRFREYDEE